MGNGNRTGLFGGLAQGIESGMRLGLFKQQIEGQKATREMERSLAKFQMASTIITNKNLPANVKLQAFNGGVVGAWNTLFTAPGSAMENTLLSPLTEWNDGFTDYVKRGQKIMADKTLSPDQRLEGLRGLQVEGQGDINLSPFFEQAKLQGERQEQADTLRAVEILTTDGKVTDDEAAEWTAIRSRSPQAALQAAGIVDKRKTAAPGEEKKTPLRQQFLTQSKDFVTVRDAYGRVQASSAQPSAAGDLALIFAFMKMTDPGSVVRESEFANAQNAAGVPERIRAQYNRVLSGERLSEKTRADFVGQANAMFKKQLGSHMRLESEFSRLATSSGFAPEDIVVDFVGGEARGEPNVPARQPSSAQPGTVQQAPATSSLSGQRTNQPDGTYRHPQTGKTFTVKGGVIQ